MSTLNELFEDSIKDLYNAEKQFLKAMPKLAKAATSPNLKAAIQKHIVETEEHVRRLEQVGQACGFKTTGKMCKAAQGLVEEATEHLEEYKGAGAVLDAAIVECAQKNEHYEICSYGTVLEWAKLLGYTEAVQIMKMTIAEEEMTDQSLSQLAESEVNQAAAQMKEGATSGSKAKVSNGSTKTASKAKTPAGKVSVR